MLNCVERHFLHSRLYKNLNNLKQIFRICDSLLGRGKDLPLPPDFTSQELANNFNSVFITKIAKYKESTGNHDCQHRSFNDGIGQRYINT